MKGSIQKTCENCRHTFECGGYQCWCGPIGITDPQMDWIACRFNDCLCPECLKKVAAGELGPPACSDAHRSGEGSAT